MRYSKLTKKGSCIFCYYCDINAPFNINLICKLVWNNGPQWCHNITKGMLQWCHYMKQCNNQPIKKWCIYDITVLFSWIRWLSYWKSDFYLKMVEKYIQLCKNTGEKQSVYKMYVNDDTITLSHKWLKQILSTSNRIHIWGH